MNLEFNFCHRQLKVNHNFMKNQLLSRKRHVGRDQKFLFQFGLKIFHELGFVKRKPTAQAFGPHNYMTLKISGNEAVRYLRVRYFYLGHVVVYNLGQAIDGTYYLVLRRKVCVVGVCVFFIVKL